jgi:hypothetical protein
MRKASDITLKTVGWLNPRASRDSEKTTEVYVPSEQASNKLALLVSFASSIRKLPF